MAPYKIQVCGVSKCFRRDGAEVQAMRPTSLNIEEGKFISIIGPSGCGKSTLFNIIAGLTLPTEGDVLADGQSIVGRSGYVGYMLQKDLLLPWRSILDNIILGMEVRGVPRTQAVAKAMPLIENWLLQIWSDFKKTVLFVTHDIDEAIYLSDDVYVFSPRPGYIKEKITVDLPRPRTPAMMTSEPFMQLKHRLLDLLAQPAEEMDQLCEERGEKDGSD